jgi:hypothetical protein
MDQQSMPINASDSHGIAIRGVHCVVVRIQDRKHLTQISKSVLATLGRPARGPTVGTLLLMLATCYAAYASPLPVLYRSEADDFFDQCFYSAFQEPVSYEAMRHPDATKWQAAMEEEKAAFFANGTWRIMPINHSWNLLSSKWVFKIKSDEYRHITRYRARLVAWTTAISSLPLCDTAPFGSC